MRQSRSKKYQTSAVEFLHLQIDATNTESDDGLRDLLRQRTLRETARSLTSGQRRDPP